jgi:CRISPR-associated endonuclease/helicase Cas3
MMPTLAPDDFDAFFEDIHGHAPFSWQSDLLRSVCAERAWPDLLDVPTGGGKTALLDIALFALALDAASTPGQRWAPRRVAMVVDRRIVVDQTARRARRIVEALDNPKHEVVRAVAQALRSLSVHGIPALSATLRGGLVRDVAWARWPDVPLLLSSTVDQVGSRLLFRGYGVSTGMRPIHAGLLGNDTVVVLDEVHLSQPFAETLRSVRDRYQDVGEKAFPNRWAVVELSATPGAPARRSTVVDPAAPPSKPSDELLVQRFAASKPTRLREVAAKRGVDDRAVLAEAAVEEARTLLDRAGHVRRLGIVVNRVATAQTIASQLTEIFPANAADSPRTHVKVLTGRMRPIDRDKIVSDVTARLASDTARDADAERMVLVATQCIEAGADLDLDALVTECASLDALRQRFGRVDRLGVLAREGTPAPGVVLALRTDVTTGAEDPVYGSALPATWTWLAAKDVVDFGVRQLGPPAGDELTRLLAPRDVAPLLRPGDLDRWVQTQPVPSPDPDPALWLHGIRADPRDVTVVWRADLTEELLDQDRTAAWLLAGPLRGDGSAAATGAVGRRARDVLAALPPTSSEAVAVPLAAARRWLADGAVTAVADVDGVGMGGAEETSARTCRPFLVWRGEESTVGARPDELRPGAVVVVPASYGGYSHGGWDPVSSTPVSDVAHEAHLRDRGTVILRMSGQAWPADTPGPPRAAADDEPDGETAGSAVLEWLEALTANRPPLPTILLRAVDWLREGGDGRRQRRYDVREPFAGAGWLVLVGRRPLPLPLRTTGDESPETVGPETVDSEADTSSFTAVEVPLDDHLTGVGALAGRLARTVGLSPELVADLELAGRLHDLGKVDSRFQLMLHRGDEIAAAMAREPLAKSALPSGDQAGRRRAAQLSGYPAGMRHEMLSVAMAELAPELRARASDWDLVLHLVASHHGHGRPFAPAVIDPDPRRAEYAVDGTPVSGDSGHALAALDSGVPQRFWNSMRRYGWFRLAWLESILRLADHRCSEREQEAEEVRP